LGLKAAIEINGGTRKKKIIMESKPRKRIKETINGFAFPTTLN
jgi:hypothetical protein